MQCTLGIADWSTDIYSFVSEAYLEMYESIREKLAHTVSPMQNFGLQDIRDKEEELSDCMPI